MAKVLCDKKIRYIESDITGAKKSIGKCNESISTLGFDKQLVYGSGVGDFMSFNKPSNLPPLVNDVTLFSFNNVLYMAVALSTTPYFRCYYLNSGVWTEIASPSSLPTGSANSVKFVATSVRVYLLVVHENSPYMTTYYLNISTHAWTKYSDPSPALTSTGLQVDGIGQGTNNLIGVKSAGSVNAYIITSNVPTETTLDSKTLNTNIAVGEGVSSVTRPIIAVTGNSYPYVEFFYKVSTSSTYYTKASSTSTTLPTGPAAAVCMCKYNGVAYCCVCHENSPYISIYNSTNDTSWTKMSNPSVLPDGKPQSCSMCVYKGKLYLALSSNWAVSYPIMIYEFDGTTWTNINDLEGISNYTTTYHASICGNVDSLMLAELSSNSFEMFNSIYSLRLTQTSIEDSIGIALECGNAGDIINIVKYTN